MKAELKAYGFYAYQIDDLISSVFILFYYSFVVGVHMYRCSYVCTLTRMYVPCIYLCLQAYVYVYVMSLLDAKIRVVVKLILTKLLVLRAT